MACALVAIGSNLGDRRRQLDAAVAALRQSSDVRVVGVSRWHETAPVGGPAGQGAFLNGALLLETALAPERLRQQLAAVEASLGRKRPPDEAGPRWQARLLDLDLLLYDDLILATPALTVPHPRMALRRFVLEPAAEVAPALVHPLFGWRIDELLRHLDASRPYVALVGVPGSGKTRLAEHLAARFGGRAILRPAQSLPAASPSLAGEIEFLRNLAGRTPAAVGSAASGWEIGDFWLDQTLAYAELRLPADELESFRAEFSRSAASRAAPRLRVLLTSSDPSVLPGAMTEAKRLQEKLIEVASRPGIGPLLRVSTDDAQNVLTETEAALTAMN